jgi:hypothetical protein
VKEVVRTLGLIFAACVVVKIIALAIDPLIPILGVGFACALIIAAIMGRPRL